MTVSPETAIEAGAIPAVQNLPRGYLVFRLGSEEYGIDIRTVQEIRSYEISTQVVSAPRFVKGFLNWRDSVVPILDMRIRLSSGEANYDDLTVVIILGIDDRFVGIVVDSVSDVMSLAPEQIRPVSSMETVVSADNLIGLGALDDRTLILMDIRKLMLSPETGLADIPESGFH